MGKHFKPVRKLSPPGIRIQLTLWYTVVSTGLIIIFGVIFYSTLQQLLASSFDTTLQQLSQQAADSITVQHGKITVHEIMDELEELDATAVTIDTFDDDSISDTVEPDQGPAVTLPTHDTDILVRVLDIHDTVIFTSPDFRKLTMPAQSLTQPLKGVPWEGTVVGSDGQPIRLYSTMLVYNKHIVGVIQVGQSLASLNIRLQHILLGLIITTPFILLLSGIGSYWLAGRAFRPIQRLAYTAHEIGARDLHQRVPVPLARDEVQDLAVIFNQMIERLERAFAQQRRFVADASHELRTPVAVVRNMTEVALSQPSSSEDYVMVLQEVNAESERLGRLINDLLALARVDEGQVQLDHDPVRLDLLAADVVASLEPLAVERKVILRTGKLDPATVLGDAARLIQVIMSLVDNALIYTNAGGSVTVAVETCESHAHLSVQDTGIGIAQEDIEHIFERFYRADRARSKVVGGSGLGLALVEWMVQAHKGTVSVKSQLGKGSTFMVTLPLSATT